MNAWWVVLGGGFARVLVVGLGFCGVCIIWCFGFGVRLVISGWLVWVVWLVLVVVLGDFG